MSSELTVSNKWSRGLLSLEDMNPHSDHMLFFFMFRNTQPNSDLFQGSKERRIKIFSLLNTCISFWKLFRNPQICRSCTISTSLKWKKNYERANGAEFFDLVFDTAVVSKRVNLRKITCNNREWWCIEQWELCWHADQSWNLFGSSGFWNHAREGSRCPSTTGNMYEAFLSCAKLSYLCRLLCTGANRYRQTIYHN